MFAGTLARLRIKSAGRGRCPANKPAILHPRSGVQVCVDRVDIVHRGRLARLHQLHRGQGLGLRQIPGRGSVPSQSGVRPGSASRSSRAGASGSWGFASGYAASAHRGQGRKCGRPLPWSCAEPRRPGRCKEAAFGECGDVHGVLHFMRRSSATLSVANKHSAMIHLGVRPDGPPRRQFAIGKPAPTRTWQNGPHVLLLSL